MIGMRKLLLAALLSCASSAYADQAGPYVDPSLLSVPWGNYSFVRQAWRGYMETVPAVTYLNGLGVVWGQRRIPGKTEEEIAADLAWAGFKRVRLEIPWGSIKWDETGLDDEPGSRTARVLKALKAHGLRPLILLNAHHGQPCPVKWLELSVTRDAPAGSRSLYVAGNLAGIEPHMSTVMSLADSRWPGPLIESYSAAAPTLDLSKRLARHVRAGEKVRIATLAYPPLHPVGTPEFERTARGWLRYAALVADFVEQHYGSDEFDMEIWNEATFGSGFLDVGHYYSDSRAPRRPATDLYRRGGSAWELARRTVAMLDREHPDVPVIWGFSNTSFFHTPVTELPAGIDGQSYHPYGTGRRCYADLVRGREELNLDTFVPPGCTVQPEGYAHSWQQTESLVRLIAPTVRNARPPGSERFNHYITEHGFIPRENGIADAGEARGAKEKFLLRAPLLWLNKGVTGLYVYNAYAADDLGFGIFERGGGVSRGMRALRRLTSRFAGAVALAEPRQLSVSLAREGGGAGILPGDSDGTHLRQQDAVAILPFQVNATRFVVAAYVMTQDFPAPLAPQPYTITISRINGAKASVTYYAPDADSLQTPSVVTRTTNSLGVRVTLTDVPRLIEIEES